MYKFRNVLVHDYMSVDPERTWGIIRTYLPTLKEKLANLLEQEPKIKELVDLGVQAYNATWSLEKQVKPKRMKM